MDLKPANLLLDFSDTLKVAATPTPTPTPNPSPTPTPTPNTLKVADFGLAKLRPMAPGRDPEPGPSREVAPEYQSFVMTGKTPDP